MFSRHVTLALLIGSVVMQNDGAYAGVYGPGQESCATFAKLYAANQGQADTIFFLWAQGFMTGIDAVNGAEKKVTKLPSSGTIDLAQAKLEIKMYCDKHPLVPYYVAVYNFYKGLPSVPNQ